MPKLFKKFGLAICTATLVACASPVSSVHTIDDRPQISVAGAPIGARLLVNDVDVGAAADFDGSQQILRLESGMHNIAVMLDNRIVHQEEVFLGNDTRRVIRIPGP